MLARQAACCVTARIAARPAGPLRAARCIWSVTPIVAGNRVERGAGHPETTAVLDAGSRPRSSRRYLPVQRGPQGASGFGLPLPGVPPGRPAPAAMGPVSAPFLSAAQAVSPPLSVGEALSAFSASGCWGRTGSGQDTRPASTSCTSSAAGTCGKRGWPGERAMPRHFGRSCRYSRRVTCLRMGVSLALSPCQTEELQAAGQGSVCRWKSTYDSSVRSYARGKTA
jgi:hypothetical protein